MSFLVAVLIGIALLAIVANWQAIAFIAVYLAGLAAVLCGVGFVIWLLVNHSDDIGLVLTWGFGIVLGLALLVGLPALIITVSRDEKTQRQLAAKRAVETGQAPAATNSPDPALTNGVLPDERLEQGPLVVETAAEARARREGPDFAALQSLTADEYDALSRDTTWRPLHERLPAAEYYLLMRQWYPGFVPFFDIAQRFVKERGWEVSWSSPPAGKELKYDVSDNPYTAMVAWDGQFDLDFEGHKFTIFSDVHSPLQMYFPERQPANSILPQWTPEVWSTGRPRNKKSERFFDTILCKVQEDRNDLLVLLQSTGMTGSAREDLRTAHWGETLRVLEQPPGARAQSQRHGRVIRR